MFGEEYLCQITNNYGSPVKDTELLKNDLKKN